MNITEKMQIERECERLVTLYCHYIDHGEAVKAADLFAENGVWESPEIIMTGRDQIRSGFQHRQDRRDRMSRHVCNNLLIDIVSQTEAMGTVYITLYRHDGEEERRFSPLDGPELVGEYRDHFLKTEEGWRIAHRTVIISFLKIQKRNK